MAQLQGLAVALGLGSKNQETTPKSKGFEASLAPFFPGHKFGPTIKAMVHRFMSIPHFDIDQTCTQVGYTNLEYIKHI